MVAAYIGGSCDGPARLAVEESAYRIELSIVIEPDPSGARSCDAVGHGRTVRARLRAAIGSRSIWDGTVRQLPFVGARLLVPTDLPTGFAVIQEQGSTLPAGTPSAMPATSGAVTTDVTVQADATVETVDWTTFYSEPAVVKGDHCQPGRGTLEVALGPDTGILTGNGWTLGATVDVEGHAARWWRQGGDRIALAWTDDGQQVAVISEVGCQGDRLLTTGEIQRVALSMRPA